MCDLCILTKMVKLSEAELNQTGDVGQAIARLQIIRSRMVKLDAPTKMLDQLGVVMATMQPYLIHPSFDQQAF